MRTLLLVPILLAFIVMGIGTHAAIFDCATAVTHKHDALVDGEITISTLVGQCGVNGIVKIGNASSARNLFADGACPLKSDIGTKMFVRIDYTCGQILILSKVPITAPLPTPCPPSPSPSQTPAQATLTATTAPAGKASVSWQLTAAPGNQDWIGMYLASEPNGSTKFVSGKWVYVTTQTGTFTTDAPANGSYEWRYLLANGYQPVARSAAFVVGPGPSPTATPTPMPSPTVTPTPVPSPSATPSPTATPTPAPTASPTPTATPVPTPSPTPSPSPTGPRVVIRILSTVTATREKQINDTERIEKLKFVGCYSNICYFERP